MLPFLVLTLASGGLTVSQMDLIMKILCREYAMNQPLTPGEDGADCQELSSVQALFAQFMLRANLLSSILGAISATILGAISDLNGRAKIIALTTLGPFLIDILILVISKYPNRVSVQWLLLGFGLDGVCGSFVATNALAHAYITDCTAPDQRTEVFGYFHGCLFLGAAFGPFLGSYINRASNNPLAMFYIAIACHVFFLVFVGWVVPESLSLERQKAAREHRSSRSENQLQGGMGPLSRSWSRTIKVSELFGIFNLLALDVEGSSRDTRTNLISLAVVESITFAVATAYMPIAIAYTKFRFDWDNFQTTTFVSIEYSTALVTLFVVLPLAKRFVKAKQKRHAREYLPPSSADAFDVMIIRSGVLVQLIGFIGLSFAENGTLFIICSSFAALGAIASPSLLSALTRLVPTHQIGQLLGLVGLSHCIARILATSIYEYIFQQTVGSLTRAVLLSMAATYGLALYLAWRIRGDSKLCIGSFLSLLLLLTGGSAYLAGFFITSVLTMWLHRPKKKEGL